MSISQELLLTICCATASFGGMSKSELVGIVEGRDVKAWERHASTWAGHLRRRVFCPGRNEWRIVRTNAVQWSRRAKVHISVV